MSVLASTSETAWTMAGSPLNRVNRLLVACLTMVAVTAASADVLTLVNDGEVRGEILNPEQSPRTEYVVRTPAGIQVTVATAQVASVTKQSAAEMEYDRVRRRYPDTVDGHWQLAQWCRQRHLVRERKLHLERVLELNPDHAEARRVLGYSRIAGRWVTQEQIMAERGYRRYDGAWRSAQEIEVLERRLKEKRASTEWGVRIERWREWLGGDDAAKIEEARTSITQIDDPAALPALGEQLKAELHEEVRLLYLAALENIREPSSGLPYPQVVELLVAISLEDPADEVRLSAIDILAADKPADATLAYIRELRSKDNRRVNRAAEGLRRMEDSRAVGPLVDALITAHKYKIVQGSPGGMSTTFERPDKLGRTPSNSGLPTFGTSGVGMAMGSSTQIITRRIFNPSVLDALVAMTGTSFGEDQQAWRNWFATQKKPQSLHGRRDAAPAKSK